LHWRPIPRIRASREVIDKIVARDAAVYGVNTGFASIRVIRGQSKSRETEQKKLQPSPFALD
jgi:histidine ammonia-lyase